MISDCLGAVRNCSEPVRNGFGTGSEPQFETGQQRRLSKLAPRSVMLSCHIVALLYSRQKASLLALTVK